MTDIMNNQQPQSDSPLYGLAARGEWREWRKGPRLDLRRLTPEQVARIRAALERGGARALGREFGVSPVAVWKIVKRLTYKDLP